MSVDLFGRQLSKGGVKKGAIGARGPPGEGFKITQDGQYDMHNKRLCNIADARDLNDATSAKTVLSIVKEQTRAICQTTASLKNSVDNNDSMINGLRSIFESYQQTHKENVDKVEELTARNAELIEILDSRVVALEGKISSMQQPLPEY